MKEHNKNVQDENIFTFFLFLFAWSLFLTSKYKNFDKKNLLRNRKKHHKKRVFWKTNIFS